MKSESIQSLLNLRLIFLFLVAFFLSFYKVPFLDFNGHFLVYLIFPAYFSFFLVFRTTVRRDVVAVFAYFFFMMATTVFNGFNYSSLSLINVVIFFVWFIILDYYVENRLYIIKKFIIFSVLFYIYDALVRINNVDLFGSLFTNFYLIKLAGGVFPDSNYSAMNLLFLYILFDVYKKCFSNITALIFNFVLFVLLLLTFSRAAILVFVSYKIFVSVNYRSKWFLCCALVLLSPVFIKLLSYDESFLSKISIINSFKDFVSAFSLQQALFGLGVRNWGEVYEAISLNINDYPFVGHTIYFSMFGYGGLISMALFSCIYCYAGKKAKGLIVVYCIMGLSYLEPFSYMFWSVLSILMFDKESISESYEQRKGSSNYKCLC